MFQFGAREQMVAETGQPPLEVRTLVDVGTPGRS